MDYQLEHRVVVPRVRRYRTPLLLLHGAWHGAWCWEDALADFARRGFEAHAISLRGHGRSDRPRQFNLCGMDDYLRDLDAAINAISPTPVVVGHSMGGMIVQNYLMERRLPGAILLCSMPPRGALSFLAGYMPRHPLAALRTVATCNTLHLVGTPELARAAFFRPDIPLGRLLLYTQHLVPEALRMVLDCVLLRLPNLAHVDTPILVIAAENDRVFTRSEQQTMAQAYGADLIVVEGAAHDLMLDPAWPVAADAIERAVDGWEMSDA